MMIRFNTILFYFFVLLPVCFINSQDKNIVVFPDENGLELQIIFEPQQYILEGENNNIISYFNAIDESSTGSPVLPSKTFFIAIPPNSKVNLTTLSEETSIINSVIPRSNPDIELAIDSSLIYKETKIDRKYSLNELYPINKYEIIGYTWIRDYYCAVLKFNTHRYNWSKRNIIEMLKTKIRITFSDVQSFNLNTSQLGAFDESLKSFIVNYEQASKFRTHHIFSSNDDSTGNWIDYSKEYVKLDIPNDGLYRIYFNDLLSYGVTPEMVNPKTFKLFSRGTELPIYIFGEGDQSFDPGDYIEFWAERNYGSPNYRVIVEKGEDYQEFMDRYSDTSTVWLTWDGGQGKRTETIDTYLPNLTDSITTHLAKVHLEQNTRLWYYGFVNPRIQLPFWQENKVWTWLQVSGPGTSSFNFNADFIVPNSSVFTISRLISWFVNASIIRQNAHKFGAILNSSNIQDSVVFDFESTGNLIASFNSNLLAGGQNTYKIVGMPNDLSTPQKALLDWVDVEYEQYTSATNDSILVNIPSALSTNFRVIKISNISVSDSSLLLYKINSQTKKINSFQLSGGVLTFTDSVGGGDRYYIISESYLQSPIFRKKKQFVNLRDPSKSADYIIVSNKILSSSVAEYANFIANNYNVNVEIVYAGDIYDEFSYGYFKPEPIKDFLKFAFINWQQPSPSYLV
ncbi:MAG: hypothetical protein IH949_10730, partial [Bacteroidetes bacterium]|nr:hypothetical protein [Bacteroidota bacterium]